MSRYLVFAFVLALAADARAESQFSVQILSATTKDKVVDGAQVIFQKDGKTSIAVTTDAKGKATAPNTLGVDDASVSMIVKKTGFSPLVVSCPCNGMSYAVSETLGQGQAEAFRVVLNWALHHGTLICTRSTKKAMCFLAPKKVAIHFSTSMTPPATAPRRLP